MSPYATPCRGSSSSFLPATRQHHKAHRRQPKLSPPLLACLSSTNEKQCPLPPGQGNFRTRLSCRADKGEPRHCKAVAMRGTVLQRSAQCLAVPTPPLHRHWHLLRHFLWRMHRHCTLLLKPRVHEGQEGEEGGSGPPVACCCWRAASLSAFLAALASFLTADLLGPSPAPSGHRPQRRGGGPGAGGGHPRMRAAISRVSARASDAGMLGAPSCLLLCCLARTRFYGCSPRIPTPQKGGPPRPWGVPVTGFPSLRPKTATGVVMVGQSHLCGAPVHCL